jgi:2,4-dienoyl-CoA reductase (NADPH2)
LRLARIGALTPEELHFLFVHQAETPDTLYKLATQGVKDVTLVEMTKRIGSDIGQTTGWIIRQDLGRAQVRTLTQTKALEVTLDGVRVEREDETSLLPADNVVLALGARPDRGLFERIKGVHSNVILVGDADRPLKAYDAAHQAFRAALEV